MTCERPVRDFESSLRGKDDTILVPGQTLSPGGYSFGRNGMDMNEPTSLVDFLCPNRNNTIVVLRRSSVGSCSGSQCNSSVSSLVSDDDSSSSSDLTEISPERKVHFASTPHRVHEYERPCKSLKSTLWWSKPERQTLRTAYLSCKDEETTEETVSLCFSSMLQCTQARGLEVEVLPRLKHYKKKHKRAVLAASHAIQTRSNAYTPAAMSDQEWNYLRDQSLRYSRHCRLVSTKMGEYDHFAVTQGETDSSRNKTPSSRWCDRQDSTEEVAEEHGLFLPPTLTTLPRATMSKDLDDSWNSSSYGDYGVAYSTRQVEDRRLMIRASSNRKLLIESDIDEENKNETITDYSFHGDVTLTTAGQSDLSSVSSNFSIGATSSNKVSRWCDKEVDETEEQSDIVLLPPSIALGSQIPASIDMDDSWNSSLYQDSKHFLPVENRRLMIRKGSHRKLTVEDSDDEDVEGNQDGGNDKRTELYRSISKKREEFDSCNSSSQPVENRRLMLRKDSGRNLMMDDSDNESVEENQDGDNDKRAQLYRLISKKRGEYDPCHNSSRPVENRTLMLLKDSSRLLMVEDSENESVDGDNDKPAEMHRLVSKNRSEYDHSSVSSNNSRSETSSQKTSRWCEQDKQQKLQDDILSLPPSLAPTSLSPPFFQLDDPWNNLSLPDTADLLVEHRRLILGKDSDFKLIADNPKKKSVEEEEDFNEKTTRARQHVHGRNDQNFCNGRDTQSSHGKDELLRKAPVGLGCDSAPRPVRRVNSPRKGRRKLVVLNSAPNKDEEITSGSTTE